MATRLNKKVVRETTCSFGHRGKPKMVALLPGDLIEIWDKGTHKHWEITIKAVESLAIKIAVAAEKSRKAAEKKAKRGR